MAQLFAARASHCASVWPRIGTPPGYPRQLSSVVTVHVPGPAGFPPGTQHGTGC
ncbi:MAG: hypothetical protein HOO67_07605 [Candidatus Peribacteraceae bacterium]|nr:hypothetical protein [Candidatus Peribacteraceae bacterium]